MPNSKRHIISSGSAASVGVLISRILGFVRDVMLSRYVGGGAEMSAWVNAFTVPNMLRSFFGEGVANSALVPVISHILEKEGHSRARCVFGAITATMSLLLGAMCIIVSLAAVVASPFFPETRISLALALLPILMVYSIFVCVSGLFSGILNLMGRFFLPSLSAVIMNVAIIVALLLSSGGVAPALTLKRISWAVLASGVIQVSLMLFLLKREGLLPCNFFAKLSGNSGVREFIRTAMPGLLGAASYQISIIIDRGIAVFLGDYAAPALYYSERLIYLPVGVFAVSMGNACLATMSKAAAKGDMADLVSSLRYGLRQVFYVSFPLAVFILLFRRPLLYLVFGGPKFGETELGEAAWAMLFYSLGIPSFCVVKILSQSYYSRKDTKTPLRISLCCLLICLALNMFFLCFSSLRQGGIALATVLSSTINAVLMIIVLRKALQISIGLHAIIKAFIKTAGASIIAIAVAYYVFNICSLPNAACSTKIGVAMALAASSASFMLIFLCANFLMRSDEQREWLATYVGGIRRRLGIPVGKAN